MAEEDLAGAGERNLATLAQLATKFFGLVRQVYDPFAEVKTLISNMLVRRQ